MNTALRGTLAMAIAGQGFVLLASFGALNAWSMGAVVILTIAITRPRGDVEWRWLLLFVPVAALASYPPRMFDETLYHLPYIRALAESGTIALHDDIRFGVFPLIHELLCVPLFMLFGAIGTHFVALLQLLLLGGLVVAWPERREAGWLAAAIVLGNPALLTVSAVTYVETALTLFVAAGFFLLTRRANDAHATLLAGFLLGTATGVKYLGWYFVAAGLLYVARPWGRNVPRYLLGVAAGAAPMVARLVVLTGNPLHPFFGHSSWRIPAESGDAMSVFRLLFDITFDRARVGWASPYTPLFAVALLIAVFFARQWRLGLICGTYLIAFVTVMPRDSRYLLSLVPLVSVAAAAYLATRLSPRAMKVAAIVAVTPLVLFPLWQMRRLGPPPMSAEARHAFLLRRYPGLRALEQKGPGRVYLCAAEELKFFAGNDGIGDHYGPYAYSKDLAKMDFDWMLIADHCPSPSREGELVYRDDEAELWRRR